MFSRILSSAKNLLSSTSPPNLEEQNKPFTFEAADQTFNMVATRRSGKGSQGNEVVQIVGPELRKRKSSVVSRDEEEVEEIEEPTSAKRRRVTRNTPKSTPKSTPQKKDEKDLEIRTKGTVCVVEIPAMTPIPVTELSASEPEREDAEAEDDDKEEVIEEVEVVEEPEVEVQVSTEEPSVPEPIAETEQTPAQPHVDTTTSPPTSKKTSPVEESQTLDHVPPSRPQSFQQKSSLPALLPDEYLNDTPSSVISFPKPSLPLVKAKKTKFADFETIKAVKDVRIGGTIYQVAKKENLNLAPKSLNKARLTKESWMQGRTGAKLGNGRRAMGKGFFVK